MKLQKHSDFVDGQWYEFSLSIEGRLFSIMAMKNQEKIIAFRNFCPHQGRRLDYIQGQFLLDDDGTIICPAHGAEFDPKTGECFSGPCQGQSLKPIKTQIKNEEVYAVLEE